MKTRACFAPAKRAHAAMRRHTDRAPNWMFCEPKHYRPSAILGEQSRCPARRDKRNDAIESAITVAIELRLNMPNSA
jgi:hypothetical protein